LESRAGCGKAVRAPVGERLGGDVSPYLGRIAEDGAALRVRVHEGVWGEERFTVFVKLVGSKAKAGSVQDAARGLNGFAHESVISAFKDVLGKFRHSLADVIDELRRRL
jgi:hypothetical protein